MARSIEVSAKTIDLAIEKGLSELSLSREEVTVEVLENPKAGFLGIGAVPAKILMTVLSDESGKKAEKKAEKKTEKKTEKKEAETTAPKEIKEEKYVVSKDAVPATGDAAEFLTKVVSFICDDASVYMIPGADEGTEALEIVGPNLGGIIGRRGETLDALQHLANLVVNRKNEGKTRIMLDAENYRAKREEALRKLAVRMANRAKKSGRRVALEPMNPNERRILHSALQNDPEVTTHSEGEEPYRRVIITLK